MTIYDLYRNIMYTLLLATRGSSLQDPRMCDEAEDAADEAETSAKIVADAAKEQAKDGAEPTPGKWPSAAPRANSRDGPKTVMAFRMCPPMGRRKV